MELPSHPLMAAMSHGVTKHLVFGASLNSSWSCPSSSWSELRSSRCILSVCFWRILLYVFCTIREPLFPSFIAGVIFFQATQLSSPDDWSAALVQKISKPTSSLDLSEWPLESDQNLSLLLPLWFFLSLHVTMRQLITLWTYGGQAGARKIPHVLF